MEWVYGRYIDRLVIVPRTRLDQCAANLRLLSTTLRAADWDEVLVSSTIEQIETCMPDLLDYAWWAQDPEPEGDRPPGVLPPLDHVQEDSEARTYAPDLLDDADALARLLPRHVMDLAAFPETSPMTEYEPCFWPDEALSQVRELAIQADAELVEDQEAISEVESLYFSC